MRTIEKVRFDIRLPKEQKGFFEYAASLGGFRTLTEFVLSSVHKQAKKIVADHKKNLASKKDREIFFNALMNPEKPNEKLKNAMATYKKTFGIL
jgi:uncharacterized protein (DUF1778 family)